MGYKIENINIIDEQPNVAIGIMYPFDGPGLFRSSFTTFDQAKSNLLNLLLTVRGERFMQPTFGTSIVSTLFEPSTPETEIILKEDINKAIQYWLPYLGINEIIVKTAFNTPDLDHTIEISINVFVKSTGADITISIFGDEGGIIKVA